MARHTKEWNEGYQAAIEAIKQAQQKGQGGGSGDANSLPDDMMQPPGAGGSGNKDQEDQQSSGESRTNPNDSSQGIVRPEDCASNNRGVEGTPNTPGGFFSKEDGDKLAQAEGYEKEGGNDKNVEDGWKEAALKSIDKMPPKAGKGWTDLKSQIEGLYKVTTDWKKTLQQVVGKAINNEDKRQAYANKNILVSQDRIARTDKDKYDSMDYMIVFIDTSGSMSNEQIKMILCETYSMALKKKPLKIYVIYCDTKIQHIDEYTDMKKLRQDAIHTTRHGSGGTAVQPLWDLLKKDPKFRKVRPDLIMIFTDGGIEHASGNKITINRDKTTMNWLVWCIMDNPGCNLASNDKMTKIIHLKTSDIK